MMRLLNGIGYISIWSKLDKISYQKCLWYKDYQGIPYVTTFMSWIQIPECTNSPCSEECREAC